MFTKQKFLSLLVAAFIIAVVLSAVWATPAYAQECYWLPSYTDFYKGKPALIVYYPGGSYPLQSGMGAYFYNNEYYRWEPVDNGFWGVHFGAPQHYSGGWAYYFIATRWIYWDGSHDWWNVDNYWAVYYCP